MDQAPYVRSILKALRILDIFGFDDPLDCGFSLGELSKRTGVAPNTLCKILKTMVRAEYLTQDAGHRYHSSHKTSMIHIKGFSALNTRAVPVIFINSRIG